MSREERLLEFSDTLQCDRLIKIFIQEQSKPYLVQEAVLKSLSGYFVRALKHEKTFGSQEGVLRFPEDDQKAWKILLHWKINGDLQIGDPVDEESAIHLLMQCWILGDKYGIKEFQDLIVLDLLDEVQGECTTIELVKLAFDNTPIG